MFLCAFFGAKINEDKKKNLYNWIFVFYTRVKKEEKRPVSPDSGLESEKPTGGLFPIEVGTECQSF